MTSPRLLLISAVLGVLLLRFPPALEAQIDADSLQQLLSSLDSDDMRERIRAASELMADRETLQTPGVMDALIDLADRENQVVEDSYRRGIGVSREYGEGYSEYYATLGTVLYELADLGDDRALRIMAMSSYNPDSPFAERLAAEGGTRLIPIAEELYSSDLAPDRERGLALLGGVYAHRQAHELPDSVARRLKSMIVGATEDRSLRRWAVQILGRVGAPDDIPLLRSIAETDPGSRTHERRGVIYPIRELAAQAILDIQKRHPPSGGVGPDR